MVFDGESIATVYYWLTVVPEPGAVIAEGFWIRRADEKDQESERCETGACRRSHPNAAMPWWSRWRAMGEGVTSVTRAELMPVQHAVVRTIAVPLMGAPLTIG
jgi:hypothetical protein